MERHDAFKGEALIPALPPAAALQQASDLVTGDTSRHNSLQLLFHNPPTSMQMQAAVSAASNAQPVTRIRAGLSTTLLVAVAALDTTCEAVHLTPIRQGVQPFLLHFINIQLSSTTGLKQIQHGCTL
jgi:hypothetical protein